MGLTFRKSIKVGPMRFNFSKSGVGVSAGFKGFRIGSGPRGNYVSVSALGVKFRQSLDSQHPGNRGSEPIEQPVRLEPTTTKEPSVEQMREIESGDVLEMGDSSAADLLAELNGKRKRIRIFPFVFWTGFLGLVCLVSLGLTWQAISWLILSFFMGIFMKFKDTLRKSTVIFYELSPEAEVAYERLHQWFDEMCRRAGVWHISAEGDVLDAKYQAGADRVIERNQISPRKSRIKELKTNLDYPVIPVGRQMLALMPERILVFDNRGVGAVAYGDLHLEVSTIDFIEGERLPWDAEVIGHTWKYVNKKGGPDRRFKDNYEIPIARYETIYFKSSSGLNEMIQISMPGVGEPLSRCFSALARITSGSMQSNA
ncbi:MAG: DUF4236 domain-containing protein [Acidobacteriota bacterium]|nr:DUF4236 domain-containing protein [Acidobacteriota bacterium]